MDARATSRSSLPIWMMLLGTIGAIIGFSWSGRDYVAASALAAVGICATIGYLIGGIRLLGFFASLGLVYQFSSPIAHSISPWLAKQLSLSPGSSGLTSLLVAGAVLVLLVSLTATLVSRWVTRNRPSLASANRFLGLGLGVAEGTLIVFLMLSGIVAAAPIANQRLKVATGTTPQDPMANSVARHVVSISSQVEQSTLAPLFATYKPFEKLPHWRGAQRTASMIGNPEAFEKLANHPAIARLQQKPSVRAAVESLANDPQLRALSMSGKGLDRETAVALLNNPNVAKLFEQPELIQEILCTLGEMDSPPTEVTLRASSR